MSPEADEAHDSQGSLIAEALRRSSSAAAELVQRHIDDVDVVLPTIVLGEVGDWFSEAVHLESADAQDARRAVDAIARLYGDGGAEMQNTIASGFLEALPPPGHANRAVVGELPQVLADTLHRMESWTPPAGA